MQDPNGPACVSTWSQMSTHVVDVCGSSTSECSIATFMGFTAVSGSSLAFAYGSVDKVTNW